MDAALTEHPHIEPRGALPSADLPAWGSLLAFTVRFPSSGPCPDPDSVARWLTAHGEPFDQEGADTLVLRALPVQFVAASDAETLLAHLEITSRVPLSRLVDLLFGISVEAGSDVRLAGEGEITRSGLWMRLADEQDRIRIAESLERARDHGNIEEVTTRLWAVVAALRPQKDDRWDTATHRIVEMKEVGSPDGIDLESARWHVEDPHLGDVIAVPVHNNHHIHTLAWRWLNEAYPGLAETHNTLH